jgi:hypothetical protein
MTVIAKFFFINGTVLEKMFGHKMFLLIFSTSLSGTFITLRINEQGSIKNACRLSCEMSFILVRFWWNFEFSRWIFEKYSNIKFHENPSRGSRVVPCGRMDGQTDVTKTKVAFRDFSKEPNKTRACLTSAGFAHAILTIKRLQTYVLDRTAPGTIT